MKDKIAIIVAATTLAILMFIGFLFYKGKLQTPDLPALSSVSKNAAVSGTFDINGVIPDGATIAITLKNYPKEDNANKVASKIPAIDGATWSVGNLTGGGTYELQGTISVNGETISQSSPIIVSAPATEESLVFNIQSDKSTGSGVITGTIRVNGYIPSGATIRVQGRVLGAKNFTTVASRLPGDERQFMSYTSATSGQTYEILGTLFDNNNKQIGISSILVVTAPASNETLTINSQATPAAKPTSSPSSPSSQPTSQAAPSAATTITGSINFNGIAPSNSRIVILQKVYNSNNYQVAVDNISPINGTTWSWNGASPSTWYDLVAVLKQRQPNGTDLDISDAQSVSVAAPASNITFTINSSLTLSTPPGPITVSCGNLSGSTWNAQISFGSVTGAGTYWYQIGTTNGGDQLENNTQNAGNGNTQVQSAQMNNGTTYYARYAYSNLQNQSANGTQFSPFTSTTQLSCNQ